MPIHLLHQAHSAYDWLSDARRLWDTLKQHKLSAIPFVAGEAMEHLTPSSWHGTQALGHALSSAPLPVEGAPYWFAMEAGTDAAKLYRDLKRDFPGLLYKLKKRGLVDSTVGGGYTPTPSQNPPTQTPVPQTPTIDPSITGHGIVNPSTPGDPIAPSQGDINIGSSNHGHSLSTAQSMPFANASYGGRLGGAPKFRSGYPANQSRRHTEEFGDLNGHNRIFQFYNYHGEKKQILDEYCRGLVCSLVRMQRGVIRDYETPIAWPFPVQHQPGYDVDGNLLPDPNMDHFLDYLEFHFKDNRRGTAHFGKTITSTSSGVLASQYSADVFDFPLKTTVSLHENNVMKTLPKLAADIALMFQPWADLGSGYVRPDVSSIDNIDLVPVRILLVKKSIVPAAISNVGAVDHQTYDVIYDDDQFGSSRVDVGCYTTVTLHNVSPADGDIVSNPDPLTSDTIAHVPLVGKMYTFSGPVPKVWDKHRDDLHHLFDPSYFEFGRYRLPSSKLEDLQEFKNPPRGRAIWSNCIGENRIMVGPGQIKKLRMNFRVRSSFGEFWQKYRNQYLSDTKMGRSVCICLEPMIRKQHIGEPVSCRLLKRSNTDESIIDFPPYEMLTDPNKPLAKPKKVLRKLFSLDQMPDGSAGIRHWYHLYTRDGGFWKKHKDYLPGHGDYDIHSFDPDGFTIYAGPVVADGTNTWALASHPGAGGIIQYTNSLEKTIEKWGYPAAPTDLPTQTQWGYYPAPWIADPDRTSRGDPMMFNVQINRMLHGSVRLKKKHILGADKTGIKRRWDDRIVANLGDPNLSMFNADGNLREDHLKDAPRDIDMLGAAGVQHIITQGEQGNISMAAPDMTGVTFQAGLTQTQHQAAMTAALQSVLPTSNGKLLTSDTTAHSHIQGISAPTVNVPAPQVTVNGGLDQAQMQAAVEAALNAANSIDIATAPSATVNVPAPNVTVQGGLDQAQMQAAVEAALNAANSIDIATAPSTTVNVPAPNVTVQGGLSATQMTNAVTAALNQAANINATVNTGVSPLSVGDMTTAVTNALNQANNITTGLDATQMTDAVKAALNQAASISATVNTATNPLNATDLKQAVELALNAADQITAGLDATEMQAAVEAALNAANSIDIATAPVPTGTDDIGYIVDGYTGTSGWVIRTESGVTHTGQSVYTGQAHSAPMGGNWATNSYLNASNALTLALGKKVIRYPVVGWVLYTPIPY